MEHPFLKMLAEVIFGSPYAQRTSTVQPWKMSKHKHTRGHYSKRSKQKRKDREDWIEGAKHAQRLEHEKGDQRADHYLHRAARLRRRAA